MRPSKAIAIAFSVGFHVVAQRARPRPLGSRERVTRYRHFSAAAPFGKCPRALMVRRHLALSNSIALMLRMMRRISTSQSRKGTNSAQASCHRFVIAGYWAPRFASNSANRSRAAASVGAV